MAATKILKALRYIGLTLLAVIIIIQFIKPERNNNPTVTAIDFNQLYPIPDSVNKVLEKACYDCHSNVTRYPWYANIQPVAWWLNNHITEGKKELNFSEFGKRTLPKQAKKLKKLAKEVREGGMPLDSYTWIHKDAILTEQEKQIIINWATNLSKEISAKWIADSTSKASASPAARS